MIKTTKTGGRRWKAWLEGSSLMAFGYTEREAVEKLRVMIREWKKNHPGWRP